MSIPAAETPDDAKIVAVLVHLVGTLVGDYDLNEMMAVLVERNLALFDVDDAAVLVTDAGGNLHVIAATSDNGELLELQQLQHEDGPCVESFRTGAPVVSDDLTRDAAKWPMWTPAALKLGYRAVASVPLHLNGETFGTMNLFSGRHFRLAGTALQAAQTLADVATIVLVRERSRQSQETVVEQLESALISRVAVEQAKGVLAERGAISLQAAFGLIRGFAREHNMRIADVAREVTSGTRNLSATAAEKPVPKPPAPAPDDGGADRQPG